MKSAGEELTRRLDRAKLRVVASFWFFVVEANEWRLILAFPMVRTEGPRAAYAAVQSALLQAPKEAVRCLSLRNITLLSPDAPFIVALTGGVPTPAKPSVVKETRIVRCVINSVDVEDAYIYRLWPSNSSRSRAA